MKIKHLKLTHCFSAVVVAAVACKTASTGSVTSKASGNSQFSIETLPPETRYAEAVKSLKLGVAILANGEAGFKQLSYVYDQLPIAKTVSPERVVKPGLKCKGSEYVALNQAPEPTLSESVKNCVSELKEPMLASATGMELFGATPMIYSRLLKDYMPQDVVRNDIVLRPLEFEASTTPADAKSKIETLVTDAALKTSAAYVTYLPTVHFSLADSSPVCFSQTLVVRSLKFNPKAVMESEAAGTQVDGKAHFNYRLFKFVQDKTYTPQNYLGFFRQEYIAGYFDGATTAETHVAYAPVFTQATPDAALPALDEYAAEDHDFSCESVKDCAVFRGRDVKDALDCPSITLKLIE